MDDKKWLPVPEFLMANPQAGSRAWIYEQIKLGNIPTLRLGQKKLLIRTDVLELMYEEQHKESNKVGQN